MRSVRAEFDKKTREALWGRANGRCELCLQLFGMRKPEYDHYPIAASLGGPATVENGRCICIKCHRAHTRDEATPIAKAKRIEEKRADVRIKRQYRWPPRKLFRRHSKEMET